MDERESLYFDTISLAESEAAHRKSLSQSRNTIYHSAVDLAGDEGRNSLRLSAAAAEHMRLAWQPGYRQSTALEHLNGLGDHTDAAIAAQVLALQNGRTHLPTGIGVAAHGDGGPGDDETHRFFEDKLRSVDFVLAYKADNSACEQDDDVEKRAQLEQTNARKRQYFEENLKSEGLQLETCTNQELHFVKVHAPAEVLQRYAEHLKIKMPLLPIAGQETIVEDSNTWFSKMCPSLFSSMQLNTKTFQKRESRIHMEFMRKYEDLYDKDHPNYFDESTRFLIINFILERQNFVQGQETPDNLGIEKLVQDGVYLCAYPLHQQESRKKLLDEWANLKMWLRLQPLDYIKDYFGAKVAFYFAWLGFYTKMLIPISIVGIFCFLYGVGTRSSDPISRDICADNGSTLMCPQCDRNCNYWNLSETCTSSRINYLIDNKTTVVFALALSLWAVLYLEFWKRYSAGLVHRWGLTGYTHQVEHPRPQYLSKIDQSKKASRKATSVIGPNNVRLDADLPFWSTKFLTNLTIYSIVVLFICISLIAIFAIVVYRMAQKASHSILGHENSMTYKIMVLPMTAAIIDLIVISVLDLIYRNLAVRLTNYEYCRTQTEYDESLTIKNYVFQFVNYYSSLFYIAFLKGKFVGYPAKYNRILGFRQEECNPGGCLMELCMQLVIIMVGKQAVNGIIEMLIPYLLRTVRRLRALQTNKYQDKVVSCNQWTEDYILLPAENTSLYEEYLEMVMQFGFITLFSLAFPLAPLLALLNNIIELRLDATKMLSFMRRPVGKRAHDIGVWHNIMFVVTRLAVASSAMIIAFSTNLIPQLIYNNQQEFNDGYLNFTLAYFNTKDFQIEPMLKGTAYANVTQCRYSEFRNPPWADEKLRYKRPMIYWKILTWRLAFIVIYQNIISLLQGVIRWAVPDVSAKLLKRIKRENFLLREHIIEYEKQLATDQATPELSPTEAPPTEQLLRQRLNGAAADGTATSSV